MLEQLIEYYGDDANWVFRHYPLSTIHDKAILSAEAAEAAGAQDAFWEYHDLLFTRQDEWNTLDLDEAQATFINYAEELDLDVEQFNSALEDGTYNELITDAETAAKDAGFTGTPTIIVNGYLFPIQQLPLAPEGIEFFLGLIRLVETQFDVPPQVIDPAKGYQATIETEKGDIVIDLFTDTAPVNVNSFVYLAEQGWYNDITFHRVLPDFMAQGGDPSGTGYGWPGYRCDDEIDPSRTFAEAGVVAMANSGADTNGGQFFITYGPTPHLDGGYTIIGEVVSGLETVEALTPRDPEQNPTFSGDKIVTIEVTEQ